MLRCSISMTGKDGRPYVVDTDANTLLEAAFAGIRQWSMCSWYSSDAVIGVRAGDRSWRVLASRIDEWYAAEFRRRIAILCPNEPTKYSPTGIAGD